MTAVDPLLALVTPARRLADNNAIRAKMLADAARGNSHAAFQAYCLQMIQWANEEAVGRDRAAASDTNQQGAPRIT